MMATVIESVPTQAGYRIRASTSPIRNNTEITGQIRSNVFNLTSLYLTKMK